MAVAGRGGAGKFTAVIETAGLSAIELSSYWREGGLFPKPVNRWRQAAHDANAKPVLTMAALNNPEKLRAQEQRESKALKRELQRKEKAMTDMAALLVLRRRCLPVGSGLCGLVQPPAPPQRHQIRDFPSAPLRRRQSICQQRANVYEKACHANPSRWNRHSRCFMQQAEEWLKLDPL